MSAQMDLFMEKAAVFSRDRRYRYVLTRIWDGRRPRLIAICLNPSTADETQDDPTVRKLMGFASRWGYGGLWLMNLFAIRGTDPEIIKTSDIDPVGSEQHERIKGVVGLARRFLNDAREYEPGPDPEVLCAWGVHGAYQDQDEHMMGWLDKELVRPICLGTTKNGCPKHPLYVSYATPRVPYTGRSAK